MQLVKLAAMAGTALLLASCGGNNEPAVSEETAAPVAAEPITEEIAAANTAAPEEAAEVAPAPAAFAICKSCHAVEVEQNGIGPSLAGSFGAQAGHLASFSYSTAMMDSGLTWDEATLDAYLENPRKLVPGTKMSFSGQKDAAKRKALIEYLKSL